MLSALAFLFLLGMLIGIHELGHLLTGKLFGVKILRFSFGFGPVLYNFKFGETEYSVSLVPLGGYVKPLTKDLPKEEQDPDHPERYMEAKPIWQRLLIILAGPFSNLLLAYVLFSFLFYFVGLPNLTTTIAEVEKDFPAAEAGLMANDKLLEVNGRPVLSWDDFVNSVRASNGKAIKLVIERKDTKKEVIVQPKLIETPEGKVFAVGIVSAATYEPQSLVSSLKLGSVTTWNVLKIFANWLQKMFSGKVSLDSSFAGPGTIYKETSKAAKTGLPDFINLLALISMNLFFFNILPLPILDGGHLYPLFFEMATGIKPGKRFYEFWSILGFIILIAILAIGVRNDILNWNK